MKFLSVLCVVLYFRSGDFFEFQNNGLRSQYQNQESIQFNSPRNIGRPSLYNGFNDVRESQTNNRFVGQHTQEPEANLRFEQPNISPEYINSYQFNRFNEQPLDQEGGPKFQNQFFQNTQEKRSAYIKPQELHTVYSKLEEKRFIDAQLNQGEVNSGAKIQQSSLSYVPQLQYKNPTQRILGTNSENNAAFMYPQTINTNSFKNINTAPIVSNEDTKLELQGVSPEFIQSLINENNMKSKTFDSGPRFASLPAIKNTEYVENRPILNNNKYRYDQPRARFESPSAEVLYNMKKALPYNINNQQLPSSLPGNIHFKNSVPNTRKIEDIIRSTPPVKRYMIIHPSGRVEHVDDIEKIIKVHPNYTMIKSQDVLKHLNGETSIPGLQIPQPKETLPVYPKLSTVEQKINKMLPSQNLSVPIVAKGTEAVLSIVSSKTDVKPSNISLALDIASKNNISLPDSNSQPNLINLSNEINQNVTSILPVIINKMLPSQNLSVPIVANGTEAELSIVASKTDVKPSNISLAVDVPSKNNISLPDSNSQPNFNNSSKEINQNVTSILPGITQNSSDIKSGLTITHSLPIIKVNVTTNIQRPSENSTDIFPTQNQQQISLDVALTNITTSTTTEKSVELKNQTKIANATLVISENSTVQPQVSDSNSSPVSQTASALKSDNFNVTILENSTPKTSNRSESVINYIGPLNQTDKRIEFNIIQPRVPSIHMSNKTSLYVNNNDSTTNVTEIFSEAPAPLISILNGTEVPIDGKRNSNTSSTIGEISSKLENISSPSVNISNSGGVWFQTDDLFWENIANSNDTQKFYFLFVPPKPNVIEKERKTTIYANGTTVEEISETRDEDGIPTVVRTTKVSHTNSSSTDV